MKTLLLFLAGLAALTRLDVALADTELSLTADTPTAEVLPRNPERSPLVLPELEYVFRIHASCHGDSKPASISLSVADTRRTFDAAQITSGELNAIRMRIPSTQIPPLVIENFCAEPTDAGGPFTQNQIASPLTVYSALSAQASLLCVSEGVQSMKYAATGLNVLLHCAEQTTTAGPALKR